MTRRSIPPDWPWFLAWFVVGAAYAVSVLGALSIGIFVLLPTVVATLILFRRGHGGGSLAGLVSGLGVPLLYVAYNNRAGPGTVCTTSDRGSSCTDEWSPWPWLVIGAAVIIGGAVIFVFRSRPNHEREITS